MHRVRLANEKGLAAVAKCCEADGLVGAGRVTHRNNRAKLVHCHGIGPLRCRSGCRRSGRAPAPLLIRAPWTTRERRREWRNGRAPASKSKYGRRSGDVAIRAHAALRESYSCCIRVASTMRRSRLRGANAQQDLRDRAPSRSSSLRGPRAGAVIDRPLAETSQKEHPGLISSPLPPTLLRRTSIALSEKEMS